MAASPATSWKCLSDSSEGGTLQSVVLPKGTDPESPCTRQPKASTNPEKTAPESSTERERAAIYPSA